jgi:hypothetical protein
MALKSSTAHHHLPPLAKSESAATLELHRHHLPKRLQGRCRLEAIFDAAVQHEKHGAIFTVPSNDHQVIHLILGKLVHDGYLARREFPLREAHDYIGLLERTAQGFDEALVKQYCGNNFPRFHCLVTALTDYAPAAPIASKYDVSRDLEREQSTERLCTCRPPQSCSPAQSRPATHLPAPSGRSLGHL